MNVAYHLKKLGNSPAMISRVGSDDRGAELLRIFQEKGLNTDFIQRDESLPTGIVNATPIERGEMSYEICAPVAWDNIQWHDSMEGLIRNADHFVFGSLAARNRQSHNTLFKLIERASNKVLDINLRPPHFNAKTVEELLAVADIVKMNEDELKKEINELRSEYISVKSNLMKKSNPSEVSKRLETEGLKELTTPPIILKKD